MLALLTPFLGILGSILPSIVGIFDKKQDQAHEIELTKLKLDAAERSATLQYDIEMVRADAVERQSILDHDKSLDGGWFINALRASVRPVITYVFFAVFLAVKISAAYVMLSTGQSVPQMLQSVWDPDTMALFSTIIAFWFGSRIMEKQDKFYRQQAVLKPTIKITSTADKKPVGTSRNK